MIHKSLKAREGVMEIALGSGCVCIGGVTGQNGRQGILLRQTCEPHGINVKDTELVAGDQYTASGKDVVIWIDNLEGLQILRRQIGIKELKMNGYIVDDKQGKY